MAYLLSGGRILRVLILIIVLNKEELPQKWKESIVLNIYI
jgi:hypothetical protein